MDKRIKKHTTFVNQKINELEKELAESDNKSLTKLKIRDLNDYQKTIVGNFQHERHIHLLVTLFFASLMLLTAGASVILSIIGSSYSIFNTLNILVLAIFAIIFVTEIFYIIYYFKLENGTQKLYEISKKIYNLLDV